MVHTIRKIFVRFDRLRSNEGGGDVGIGNVLRSSESLLNEGRHEDKNKIYDETNDEKSTFQRIEMTIEEENDQQDQNGSIENEVTNNNDLGHRNGLLRNHGTQTGN